MSNKVQRPVSPHLTVYKMQMTSLLSILHRVSGIFLFIGLSILLWWLIYCIHNYGYSYIKMIYPMRVAIDLKDDFIFSIFRTCVGKCILILWSYCLFYHMFAGIRHLVLDMGFGFKIKQAYLSGWAVIIFSMLVWLAVWIALLI